MLPAKKSASSATKVASPPATKAPQAKEGPQAKKAGAPAKPGAPPSKVPATKVAAQATITLKQIASDLADTHALAKKQAEAILSDLVAALAEHLKKGDKIRLTGLGILEVRSRAARMGRNPATGEAIQIGASKKIAFRPAKELKEAV
ncbi:MAG: HU family DNA-binding protein [Acetobacteraceae bacterium]|nr:HU family DNA-binding protein [Acetobacteraceae bacterium]